MDGPNGRLAAAAERQARSHEQVREAASLAERACLERDQALTRLAFFEKATAGLQAELASQAAAVDTELRTRVAMAVWSVSQVAAWRGERQP